MMKTSMSSVDNNQFKVYTSDLMSALDLVIMTFFISSNVLQYRL